MANLRLKVEDLGERFYCPEHRDEVLLCSQCDVMELSDNEWQELAELLERAGFFNHEPLRGYGICWYCQEST